MKSYRHNASLFFIIPFVLIVVAYIGYSTWTAEEELQGGEAMRYALTLFCAAFVPGVGYLFLRYGVVRYYLVPEGILVKRIGSSTVRAWPELAELKINWRIKYFVVRDREGTVVIFSSLDLFKDVDEFLRELQKRIPGPDAPAP